MKDLSPAAAAVLSTANECTAQLMREIGAVRPYTFRGVSAPALLVQRLQRYAQDRVLPGDFLCAVLENNLLAACSRADTESLSCLAALVHYCHWELPGECWGSKEKVATWIAERSNA